jgi:YjbE family integral membrane protein
VTIIATTIIIRFEFIRSSPSKLLLAVVRTKSGNDCTTAQAVWTTRGTSARIEVQMEFLSQILLIVLINLALSGDNAVVIGMAAHRLEPRQRKRAILIGGGAAIGLRILLTAIAAFLLGLSGLHLIGGLLLLWIGFKMLKAEEETHEGIKVAASMKDAIITILIADLVMSIDNVLGVAGASNGSTVLLSFGLVLSMGIIMFMGNLVANLINKLWWLAYVGSGVIVWTGAHMIFDDKLFSSRWGWMKGSTAHITAAAVTGITLMLAHWYHRVRTSRQNLPLTRIGE